MLINLNVWPHLSVFFSQVMLSCQSGWPTQGGVYTECTLTLEKSCAVCLFACCLTDGLASRLGGTWRSGGVLSPRQQVSSGVGVGSIPGIKGHIDRKACSPNCDCCNVPDFNGTRVHWCDRSSHCESRRGCSSPLAPSSQPRWQWRGKIQACKGRLEGRELECLLLRHGFHLQALYQLPHSHRERGGKRGHTLMGGHDSWSRWRVCHHQTGSNSGVRIREVCSHVTTFSLSLWSTERQSILVCLAV